MMGEGKKILHPPADEDQFGVAAEVFGIAGKPLAKQRNAFPDFLATGVDKIAIRQSRGDGPLFVIGYWQLDTNSGNDTFNDSPSHFLAKLSNRHLLFFGRIKEDE